MKSELSASGKSDIGNGSIDYCVDSLRHLTNEVLVIQSAVIARAEKSTRTGFFALGSLREFSCVMLLIP
jgi:hypothetical protein